MAECVGCQDDACQACDCSTLRRDYLGTVGCAQKAEVLAGRLRDLGKAPAVQVGFQYRLKKGGTDLSEKTEPWSDLPLAERSTPGEYSVSIPKLEPGREYEFRAVVRHPLIEMYGVEKSFHVP